jgi:trans-aconitate methyltransferase
MSKHESPRVEKLHHFRSMIDDAVVLLSLHEVGAYGALAAGPATADEVARKLGLVARRLNPFLELAAHLGMIRYEDGRFGLHDGDEKFFDPTLPYGVGLPATTLPQFLESRGRAPDILRGGATIEVAAAGGKTSVEKKARFLRYMDTVTREPANELAALIPDGDVRRIIDLGCGPGTYAYAALERFPQARALLADRPEAEDEIARIAAERGLAGRVNFQAIDLGCDEIPAGQDIAILSNVVHCFGPETNAGLIARIARALAPGGALLIKDCAIDDDRGGPVDVLRFGISMVMFSEEGSIYSAHEVIEWCRAAGLRDFSTHFAAADENYVVIAHR